MLDENLRKIENTVARDRNNNAPDLGNNPQLAFTVHDIYLRFKT